jgi:hypothetical protein
MGGFCWPPHRERRQLTGNHCPLVLVKVPRVHDSSEARITYLAHMPSNKRHKRTRAEQKARRCRRQWDIPPLLPPRKAVTGEEFKASVALMMAAAHDEATRA